MEKLEKLEELIKKLKELPPLEEKEVDIFSLGARKYYENPTTDVLSFFLDDNESHSLGNLVLNSLIECLPDKYNVISNNLIEVPDREVVTESGKRIDLILESDDAVFVIENKIYNTINNPFEDYENHINTNYKETKEKIYIVLSPNGENAEGKKEWHGISYGDFIQKIKNNLGIYLVSNPISKWSILLREFLLNLEDITMKKNEENKEAYEKFVFENFSEIMEIEKIKKEAQLYYFEKLKSKLEEDGFKVYGVLQKSWNCVGGKAPAFIFHLSEKSIMRSVLFFHEEHPEQIGISVYAIKSKDMSYFDKLGDTSKEENNGEVICYCKFYENLTLNGSFDKIVKKIEKRLKACLDYEENVLKK